MSEVFLVIAGGTSTWHDYIQANGHIVAERFCTYGTACSTTVTAWRYFVTDNLGSIAVVTDATGAVVERDAYDPWGKRRNINGTDDAACALTATTFHGYTGHDHIDANCLINMNARVYDPTIGRFMSADSVVQSPFDSQSLNRYAYVENGPMSATDPTGHDDDGGDGGVLKQIEGPILVPGYRFPIGSQSGIPVFGANAGYYRSYDNKERSSGNIAAMMKGSILEQNSNKGPSNAAARDQYATLNGISDTFPDYETDPVDTSDGSGSKSAANCDPTQQLSYTISPSDPGTFAIQFHLLLPSEKGGWIVQEIQSTAYGDNGSTQSAHFWEAWHVSEGATTTDQAAIANYDDRFQVLSSNMPGHFDVHAVATYYDGLQLPDSFQYNTPGSNAGTLRSTTVQPGLPISPIPPVIRDWSHPFEGNGP
jgi:RHS repeat-associated protein